MEEHPETGTGKPKPLRHEQSGVWSRKIDDKHRMLYTIEEDTITVFIISLWGHYGDK
ncbi:MAG: Txe/YoeB family addiction module toxin [Bacteroides sp.]|nr:Txe/YoeB family addiction module toxin [Bacteroides sp.]